MSTRKVSAEVNFVFSRVDGFPRSWSWNKFTKPVVGLDSDDAKGWRLGSHIGIVESPNGYVLVAYDHSGEWSTSVSPIHAEYVRAALTGQQFKRQGYVQHIGSYREGDPAAAYKTLKEAMRVAVVLAMQDSPMQLVDLYD